MTDHEGRWSVPPSLIDRSGDQGILDDAQQASGAEGFGQQREAFIGDESLHQIGIVKAGDEEHREVWLAGTQTLGEDGAGKIGHHDIGEEQMDGPGRGFVDLDGAPAAAGNQDAVPGGTQGLLEQAQHSRIVIHREDGGSGMVGRCGQRETLL